MIICCFAFSMFQRLPSFLGPWPRLPSESAKSGWICSHCSLSGSNSSASLVHLLRTLQITLDLPRNIRMWTVNNCEVAQSCPTLYNPMGYLPGSSVHEIFQARVLEWVAISFSRGSSQPRNWTHISCIFRCILWH